ncbi:patatin-like phospholipase family protein [Streptomyces chiangmaiensis]
MVLGAGGSLGAAWTIGALCALEDAYGWDPRSADVILGTSAGAIVGSALALGTRPCELRDHQRGHAVAFGPLRGCALTTIRGSAAACRPFPSPESGR